MSSAASPPGKHAALPWYNHPATRSDLEAVWRDTRARLGALGIEPLPAHLDHDAQYQELWQDARLILSQCCGLDLFVAHGAKLVAFAAPVVSAYDVPAGAYRSYIVTRSSSSLSRPRVAVNNQFSHSGHTAIRIWLANRRLDNYSTLESGSHANSLAALRAGDADLAASDALSWTMLDTSGLTILDTSDPMPAPPFVMGTDSHVPAEALTAALNDAFKQYGQRIGIRGVVPVTRSDYQGIANAAAEHGILATAGADQ